MSRLLIVLFLAASALAASPDSPRGYYRYPALHDDTIVFTAEGDLWRVATTGGAAQRLTSHPGAETLAAISPDGTQVAFTANYEGQTEAYAMPLAGGTPTRLTFEGETPGAQVRGWTASGLVLYSTRHFSTLPNAQLVTVDPRTLAREFVRLAQADEAVYADSGAQMFFTRLSAQSSHAKRYKGGTAQQLWRWGRGLPEAVRFIANYDGTSRWPMWWQGRVYFVTDRDGTMNVWSARPDGTDLRPHTKHADFGVKHPSLSRGRIAYQNGADIWLLELASGKTAIVPIALNSDFEQRREKWVTKPMDYLSDLALSPNGDRVALTVRGQVFVAPVGRGRLVEVTRQSGVRYRQASFGDPAGKSLILLSDESGEVEFWRAPANGVGARTQLTKDGATLRVEGFPSPDGKWLVSAERNQDLLLFNLETAEKRLVAHSRQRSFDEPEIAWSPDSRWFAFVDEQANGYSVIYLCEAASGQVIPVTSARTQSNSPAWSRDGKWLYFLSERSLQSTVQAPWGLRQPEPFFDRSVKIYQLALSGRTRRSPFQPDDEVSASEKRPVSAKSSTASDAKTDADGVPKETVPAKGIPDVMVELDGIASRLWEVPVTAGNYSNLTVNDKALFFTDRSRGGGESGDSSTRRLRALEIKNKDVEAVTVLDNVSTYRLSADGRKLLLRRNKDLYVVEAAPKAAISLDQAKVNLDGLKFPYNPPESWRQMFTDAWRLHRDYFYDQGMHGIDWRANLTKHLPLLDRVTDRDELNDALAYMMSELSALHTAVQPGDVRTAPEDERIGVASLGARLLRDEAAGGYKITDIYESDPDYPDKLSPLQRPWQKIVEGDVIESINGVPTLSVPDVDALLRNQGNRQVLLRVKPAAGGDGFDAIVTALNAADATALRYSDWELSRRRRVEQKGAGRIGYVHLRAMGTSDYAQWARDYYPVLDRPALILDLRHNRGGNIESWLLSRLMRKAWMWWAPRGGDPFPNMQNAFRGHLVVLVDEWTASDGETMANGVRRLGLGTIIGTRTWGGGIWLRGINRLVDRGVITAAENGSFVPDEGWVVEGPGITPDIVVDNPPAATFRGEDAQLDAAIAKLQELLAKDPRPVPTPPAPVLLKRPETQ